MMLNYVLLKYFRLHCLLSIFRNILRQNDLVTALPQLYSSWKKTAAVREMCLLRKLSLEKAVPLNLESGSIPSDLNA